VSESKPNKPQLLVRVLVFGIVAFAAREVFARLFGFAGPLVAGAMVVFGSALLSNGVTLRIYERARFSDIGLKLDGDALRNFGWGATVGSGAALLVIAVSLLARLATLVPAPEQPRNVGSAVFVAIVLLMGAMGEEILFRGYGFQLLLARWGAFSTILPTAVLFAAAHGGNPDITELGYFNTFLWGVLFGLCFLRSGDLWLPIGVHFAWNWTLPLFGANLSGFTMSVTGYAMKWNASPIWSGGGYGPEASLLTTFVMPLAAYAIWRLPVRVDKPFLLREAS